MRHVEEGCQSVDTLPRYSPRREGEGGDRDRDVAVPAPVAVAQVHVHFHGRMKEGDGEGEDAGAVEGSKPPAYTVNANTGDLGTRTMETAADGGGIRNGSEGGGRDEVLASPAAVHIHGD